MYNIQPRSQQETTDQTAAVQPAAFEHPLYKLTIETEPEDALIYANGRIMGRGQFSRIYEEGRNITFRVEKEGYEPYEFSMDVSSDTARVHTVSLVPQTVEEAVTDSVENPTDTAETPVENTEPENVAIDLQIAVNPADAQIFLNEELAGEGTVNRTCQEGETVEVRVERNGYETENMSITAGTGLSQYQIDMKPRPIEDRFRTGSRDPVGTRVFAGGMVYFADSTGAVFGINTDNGQSWSVSTGNSPNQNAIPVIMGGNLYFSGVKEFSIINRTNGSERASVPLSGDMVHLFGQKVLTYGNNIYFPANSNILVMNKDSGETIGQIPVPGGSFMSPNIWNNRIIIANQRGELLVINPDSGNVESQIVTQALQPVATRVGIYSNYAVFAGRKGNVVAANLQNGSVLWQRNINGTIDTDITTGPNGCYVFLNNTITGMSWSSGENLFSPIASASCAPLLSDGKLYYGTTGGQLIIANASNGRVERRLDVGSPITATPVKTGDDIAVVAGGELLIINPEGIVP